MPKTVFKPEIVPNQPGYRVDEYLFDVVGPSQFRFTFVKTVRENVPDDEIRQYLKQLAKEVVNA